VHNLASARSQASLAERRMWSSTHPGYHYAWACILSAGEELRLDSTASSIYNHAISLLGSHRAATATPAAARS
jgi:hypothetical protein